MANECININQNVIQSKAQFSNLEMCLLLCHVTPEISHIVIIFRDYVACVLTACVCDLLGNWPSENCSNFLSVLKNRHLRPGLSEK